MPRFLSVATLLCLGTSLVAQDAVKVSVPAESLECLVEHRQAYMDLPRAVLIFSPALCPDIANNEAAQLVENNAASSGSTLTRVMMLKTDFTCLVDKIENLLASETEIADEEVSIALDCS